MHKFLLIITVLFLSLGQLANLSKNSGISLYLFDAMVGIFAFYTLLSMLISKKLILPKYLFLMFAFAGVAGASLFFNLPRLEFSELLVSAFYLARLMIYLLAGVGVYNLLINNVISEAFVDNLIYVSGLFICVGGIIQLIVLPDFTVLDPKLGWDPHKHRLASTFFDPNFVGAYLSIVAAMLLGRVFDVHKPKKLYTLILLLVLSCIFLTFSRSAWLMIGVVILVYGLFRNKVLLILALLVVFLAYFAVPRVQTRISGVTDPADSASFRIISWKNALAIWQDHPLLGVGYNTFRYSQRDYGFLDVDSFLVHSGAGADSSVLFVLVTTGIIGTAVFLIWYFYPLVNELFFVRYGDLVLPSVLLGLFGSSQFINSIFYPQILFLLFVLLAKYSRVRILQ